MQLNTFRRLLVLALTMSLFLLGSGSTRAQSPPVLIPPQALILNPGSCSLSIDGREVALHSPVQISPENQSLISLRDVVLQFSCHLEYDVQGGVHVQRLEKDIVIKPNEYYTSRPGEDLTALEQLDAYYIPLRSVAENLGYFVIYDDRSGQIQIESPEYRAQAAKHSTPPPDSALLLPPPANLPTWGRLVPELAACWPQEKIIAGYYTRLINSPAGRTSNISLSCTKIDGTVLAADQIFSFNKIVGERTEQAGYRVAKIFVGNRVSTGLGGGVCQTSSTLYNTALEAGLQIVERHPHTLKVAYVAPNRDATVSWGGADLKFRNNQGRPLKIRACVYGPYVLAAICELP